MSKMLDPKSIENLKAISSVNPSLLVNHYSDDLRLCVTLYIDKKNQYSNFETIGQVSVERSDEKINGKSVYFVTDTTGAYPGFGSLLYQSLMIELSKIEGGALLISDRENVTQSALGLYKKMESSKDFDFIVIDKSSSNYSDEFMYEDSDKSAILNKAYFWKGAELDLKYHDILISNHRKKNLTLDQMESIVEDGDLLGEWVEINLDELIELRDRGFDDLKSFKITEPEMEY